MLSRCLRWDDTMSSRVKWGLFIWKGKVGSPEKWSILDNLCHECIVAFVRSDHTLLLINLLCPLRTGWVQGRLKLLASACMNLELGDLTKLRPKLRMLLWTGILKNLIFLMLTFHLLIIINFIKIIDLPWSKLYGLLLLNSRSLAPRYVITLNRRLPHTLNSRLPQ